MISNSLIQPSLFHKPGHVAKLHIQFAASSKLAQAIEANMRVLGYGR